MRRGSDRGERGYAVVLVAVALASGLFIAFAALSVDTSRWYVEIQRVQKAADAAALAGVPYMPHDLASATAKAKEVARRNGFDDASSSVVVTVSRGALPSQLKVTITSKVGNAFGRVIGVGGTTIAREATADYQGAAPMGSPCNTFGNEPSAGAGASSPTPTGTARGSSPASNCNTSEPQFWATIEGPEVDKNQGDRYQTQVCSSSTSVDFCSGGDNAEYYEPGYFFVVRVQQGLVGQPVKMQLYDPAYVVTGTDCSSLPSQSNLVNNMNPYVTTDGKARYGSADADSSTGAPYCNGDGNAASANRQMTTSFALRAQTDTLDPLQATPISGCTKQYTGRTSAPTVGTLRSTDSAYVPHLAEVFHNWATLCTFTPSRAGDYYLQVRSNVAPAGTTTPNNGKTPIVYSGNANVTAATGNYSQGTGNNSFAVRAVAPAGMEKLVAVSGYDRMPLFANASAASSTFNLIRVLPGAAGKFITFSYFDAGDAQASGGVQILLPTDAKNVNTGVSLGTNAQDCEAVGGSAGNGATYATCYAPISKAPYSSTSRNNGRVQTMTIPVPTEYTCSHADPNGCWYRVTISFGSGSVTDVTTWDATVTGDPVRLVQ